MPHKIVFLRPKEMGKRRKGTVKNQLLPPKKKPPTEGQKGSQVEYKHIFT